MSKVPFKSVIRAGIKGGVIATVVNLIIYEVARRLFALQFIVEQGPERGLAPIAEWQVIAATVVPAILASLVFSLLLKFTKYPNQIFIALSAIALIGSFYLPFTQAQLLAEQLLLSLMHIAAAVFIVLPLLKLRSRAV